MDILLENVPQMLPETQRPLSELCEYDPFDIVDMMYQPGMILATPALVLQLLTSKVSIICSRLASR